jgi:MFS superfamily sulfate permease-like transporter
VPGGLPALRLPQFDPKLAPQLLADAAGLALVSFSSLMLTSRSFASKNGYDVDPDRDFAALGAANLASALSQGFTISGADSRTAVADAAGGRTRVTGLVAAAGVALVVIFLTGPLRFVPQAAMAAVLVMAGASLVDVRTVRLLYRIDPGEAGLCVLATVGVVVVGAVNAILLVVILSLLRFVRLAARPSMETLGRVKGMGGWHALARHTESEAPPGLLLLRFNGSLVFFNAAFFKQKIMSSVRAAGPDLRNVVLDLLPVTVIDATGIFAVKEVADALHEKGIGLCAAGRATEWREWSEKRNYEFQRVRIFPSLQAAVDALGAKVQQDAGK